MNERKQKMIEMRNAGATHEQIGNAFGITKQRVSQIIGQYWVGSFRGITCEDCIYPNLRRWMNENRISKSELCRRMYGDVGPENHHRISLILSGKKTNFFKSVIDRLIEATGLSYEELFSEEEK